MIARVQAAWKQAGLEVSAAEVDKGRIHVTVARPDLARALTTAVRALSDAGCRTCWERHTHLCSVYAFSETGSVCIDLSDGHEDNPSLWRRSNGSLSPSIALLGPDGVGKSTALRLVRQWFEEEAPFVEVTVRQWRPDLLPALASLAGKPDTSSSSGDTRPRRTPGKLPLLRLFYYYLDFLLGSWWKDRNRQSGLSRMIVYDRCALDMTVDPVRFALKSARGTGLLWKLTPRPQTRVVLYDDAERIARRKDDLQQHDIAAQLEIWLQLATRDEVHAIIRVNDGPQEMARRIRDLFIETFVRHHEHDLAPPPAQFAPGLGGVAATAPFTHAVVPSFENPRFLIPLGNRAAAAASLNIYNAQRPIARLAKSALKFGLRTGIAQPFLRHRICVPLEDLKERLSHTFGHTDLAIAVSLGTPGPNQKPALQIMNPQGRVIGFAKIGCNDRTIASIRNEHAALTTLEPARFSSALVPRVLDAAWLGNSYILVQSPADEMRNTGPLDVDDRYVSFLAELHRLDPSHAALPRPGEASIARIRRAGLHYYAHLLERVRSEYFFDAEVPCGPGHGDFTPWNIRESAGKLLVFDWETFDARTPAGWDLFHRLVAGEVEVRGATPGAIFKAIMYPGPVRERIESYFLAIGADQRLIEPLFVSYAAHALTASLLQLGNRATAKDRELERTWAALLALTCNPGKAADERTLPHPVLEEAL